MPGAGRHHTGDDAKFNGDGLNLFLGERCYTFTGCPRMVFQLRLFDWVMPTGFGQSGFSRVSRRHMRYGFPFAAIGTFDVFGKTAPLSAAAYGRAGRGLFRERWNGSHGSSIGRELEKRLGASILPLGPFCQERRRAPLAGVPERDK